MVLIVVDWVSFPEHSRFLPGVSLIRESNVCKACFPCQASWAGAVGSDGLEMTRGWWEQLWGGSGPMEGERASNRRAMRLHSAGAGCRRQKYRKMVSGKPTGAGAAENEYKRDSRWWD